MFFSKYKDAAEMQKPQKTSDTLWYKSTYRKEAARKPVRGTSEIQIGTKCSVKADSRKF